MFARPAGGFEFGLYVDRAQDWSNPGAGSGGGAAAAHVAFLRPMNGDSGDDGQIAGDGEVINTTAGQVVTELTRRGTGVTTILIVLSRARAAKRHHS